MARRRNKKTEEPENNERWLISYADFITLLFAFFVVMYSISSINEGKYRVVSDSIKAVFSDNNKSNNPIQEGKLSRGKGKRTSEPGQPDGVAILNIKLPFDTKPKPIKKPKTITNDKQEKKLAQLSLHLKDSLKSLEKSDVISIKQTQRGIALAIKSQALFAPGQAKLSQSAIPIIKQVADVLKESLNYIDVQSYTDNQPIKSTLFPSNWELSAARAATITHVLTELEIQPQRLSAVGYGQYRPIAKNNTPEGQSKNRRIVLLILKNQPKGLKMLAKPTLKEDTTKKIIEDLLNNTQPLQSPN